MQIFCQYCLGYPPKLEGKTIVEDTLYSNHKSWSNKSCTHLEVLSLVSSFVLNFNKETNQLQSLLAMILKSAAMTGLVWYGLWYNKALDVIGALNHFLIRYEVSSVRRNALTSLVTMQRIRDCSMFRLKCDMHLTPFSYDLRIFTEDRIEIF